jgi:riboflavin biosynthesis pyrimidine reductase
MSAVSQSNPFEVMLDETLVEEIDAGGLVPEVREIYGGDWVIPTPTARPYCFSNFVMSHDGRISFSVPGHEGGGDVSDFNAHDQWLMGMLRSRADAVMVGANTLRLEPEHLWTAEFIAPDHAELFDAQRRADGRSEKPLQVFVTSTGDILRDAAVFTRSDLNVVVVTTEAAEPSVNALELPRTAVLVAGETEVDLVAALETLFSKWEVRTLLCEGGPRLYGSLIATDGLDEEFLTLSPVVIGSHDSEPRPGLIEGQAFAPGTSPRANLLSVRRVGDHLFLRTVWNFDTHSRSD